MYSARRALKTVVFEKTLCGGQMLYTTAIENYPGFQKVTGAELSELMKKQAESFGVEIRSTEVEDIRIEGGIKRIQSGGETIDAKSIVFATGGDHKKLGLPSEKTFAGKGVGYCAICDGPFFKDKTVAVVGGGNTAAEDALYLSQVASKVYIIHRREKFRCEERQVDEMRAMGVEFVMNAQVKEFKGEGVLNQLLLETKTGEKKISVDGCFISIGVAPETTLAKKLGVELDSQGFIKVDEDQKTNLEGVFAAGDVTGGVMQVATAVGEGCVASLKAYEYVKKPYWA
ncbi:MAG TPA: thioredoxin-disulfide reductase [Candidatus Altiarchaeales archaeon]|nr:thioredoxin-disulfide reductase [Candidatus Altiarchaeales archaeon]